MKKEEIAKACHEINRAYCQALGDDSQQPWDETPDWAKESAMHGVELHIANPNAGPEASHESWMKEKEENGWVYGEVKDPDKKEHPCMVPFDELPVEQQAKDYIFRAVVHVLSTVQEAKPTGKLPLAYIGRRPDMTDAIYNTGLWAKDQVKHVPELLARKMAKLHPDVYAISEAKEVAEVVEEKKATKKEVEEDMRDQDARDQIRSMKDVGTIREFIQRNFNGHDLHHAVKSVDTAQQRAIELIDRFGMPE